MTQAKYYDSASGTWKPVIAGPQGPTGAQGPSGTISVNGPITNTGTSTAAVLGLANNPTIYGNGGNGTHTLDLRTVGGSSNQIANLRFDSTFGSFPADTGPRRTADIWGGFTSTWGSEFLAFGVGTGGGNDNNSLTYERMRIDGSGRVTTPYQPAFYAKGAESNATLANLGDLPFSISIYNIGSCFNTSNYRFTAPVAGVYQINVSLFYNGGSNRVSIKVNGGSYNGSQNLWDTGQWGWAGNIYLNANDYVTVGDWQSLGGATPYMGHSSFSGYLVG